MAPISCDTSGTLSLTREMFSQRERRPSTTGLWKKQSCRGGRSTGSRDCPAALKRERRRPLQAGLTEGLPLHRTGPPPRSSRFASRASPTDRQSLQRSCPPKPPLTNDEIFPVLSRPRHPFLSSLGRLASVYEIRDHLSVNVLHLEVPLRKYVVVAPDEIFLE